MTAIVIPAYKPDNTMIGLLQELKENQLPVLVVDDGSGDEFKEVFKKAEEYAAVIHSEHNQGKGAALKKGFSVLKETYPQCTNFITADADGQHSVKDILRVKSELEQGAEFVLTVRNLSRKIPFRSKIGNDLSRWVYTILTGHYFPDNQSGLRGFGIDNIPWLLNVAGDKYDYEMNMLYTADKQSIPITTISIEAIYIDGNKSSHFNPLLDTFRIYKRLFSSAVASFIGFGIMELLFLYFSLRYGYDYIYITAHSATMAALLANILINKFIVFRKFNYRDGRRAFLHAILRSILYFAGVIVVHNFLPMIPLFASFNIFVLILVPIEYNVIKNIRIAKYRDINKEQ